MSFQSKLIIFFFFHILIIYFAMVIPLVCSEGQNATNIWQMGENEFNPMDCSPNLIISEEGIVASQNLTDFNSDIGFNTVRAVLPIPPFNFDSKTPSVFYFEVQILKRPYEFELDNGISIGFCTKKFPLEDEWLGSLENSIGIYRKGEISIDNYTINMGNVEWFKEGDVIGIGLMQFPIGQANCFWSRNGELLGRAYLPPKYIELELFPAVSMFYGGESVRANFGKEDWQFNEFGRVFKE